MHSIITVMTKEKNKNKVLQRETVRAENKSQMYGL